MQHLLITGFVISIMLGFISAYHINAKFQIHKYSFLKTYRIHILVLNLIVISLTVTRYFRVNIVNAAENSQSANMTHFMDGLYLFGKGLEYFGIIIIAYTLIKTLFQAQNRHVDRIIKNTFVLLSILTAFAFGIGMTGFFYTRVVSRLNLFCTMIWEIVILLMIIIFSSSLLNKQRMRRDQKQSLPLFLLFYITVFSIFFIQSLFRFEYQIFIILASVLTMSLFPILWSRYELKLMGTSGSPANFNPDIIERFVQKYHISDREKEILEYLLRGYSNREIQHSLYLSPHTVKNHNYNLYKKLGVSNRTELMRKAFESPASPPS